MMHHRWALSSMKVIHKSVCVPMSICALVVCVEKNPISAKNLFGSRTCSFARHTIMTISAFNCRAYRLIRLVIGKSREFISFIYKTERINCNANMCCAHLFGYVHLNRSRFQNAWFYPKRNAKWLFGRQICRNQELQFTSRREIRSIDRSID